MSAQMPAGRPAPHRPASQDPVQTAPHGVVRRVAGDSIVRKYVGRVLFALAVTVVSLAFALPLVWLVLAPFDATGMRVSEVLALRWEDVDLATTPATVTVRAAVVHDPERGLHRQEGRKGHSLKGDEGLVLTLPSWATAILLEQRIAAGASQYVFPARGGGLRSPANFRTSLRAALRGTGLEGRVTPHALRRTVATAIEASLGVDAAAAQLGHSGTAVTERHYIAKGNVAPDTRTVLEGLGPGVSGD